MRNLTRSDRHRAIIDEVLNDSRPSAFISLFSSEKKRLERRYGNVLSFTQTDFTTRHPHERMYEIRKMP